MANESFALPEQKAVFSQEVASPVTPQAGLVGGNISGGLQLRDPSKDAPTVMDTLFAFAAKMGDKKLAEYEAQEKNRRFMAGVGRAAAGAAAKDIEENQPWWAKMFGGGDVVAGARAWEGITDANQMEASVLDRMPDLRALSPEKAQAALLDIHKDMQSGDPVRDATQNAMWVKALPRVLKLHAKEHFAYQQEVATESQRRGIESAFDSVESQFKAGKGFSSPEDEQDSLTTLIQAMTPPTGVNQDTFRAQVVEGLANSVAAGKFQPYTLAKKNGLLDNIPAQQQRALDRLYDQTAREKLAETVPPELLDRMALASTLDDPKAIRAEISSINAAAVEATGIDYPLISSKTSQSYTSRAIQRTIGEREAAVKAAKSAADREVKQAALDAARAAAKEQLSREQKDLAGKLATVVVNSKDPNSLAKMMVDSHGIVPATLLRNSLPAAVAQAWGSPKLSPQDVEDATHLPPELRAERTAVLEAEARARLLSKEGVPLDAVRKEIHDSIATGDYSHAKAAVDALAMMAVGPMNEKLVKTFVGLVPENQRALVATFANLYNNLPPDPKTGARDAGAAWAAAEAQTLLAVSKPPKAADKQAIRDEIDSQAKKELSWNPFSWKSGDLTERILGDDSNAPQPKRLLALAAESKFNSLVSSGEVTPARAAVEAAKSEIIVLPGTGMAFLKATDPKTKPIEEYLPDDQKHWLKIQGRLGNALRDSIVAKGGDPDASILYRADHEEGREPYFVATAPGGSGFLVLTLSDLVAASKKRNTVETQVQPSTTGSWGSYSGSW